MKLVKGAETQNELVPHPQVVVKNQGGYLSCRGPPWEKGVTVPYQAPLSKKRSPQLLLMTTSGDCG